MLFFSSLKAQVNLPQVPEREAIPITEIQQKVKRVSESAPVKFHTGKDKIHQQLLTSTSKDKDYRPLDTLPGHYNRVMDINPRLIRINDSAWIYTGICKPLKAVRYEQNVPEEKPVNRPVVFEIHGNVEYDYLYRSFADTPYFQKNFRQHTIRTSLNITVREMYPVRVNFVVRKSNSPFFKDFFDGGLLFDKFGYQRNIKQQVLDAITKQLQLDQYLKEAQALLEAQIKKFDQLRRKLSSDALAQEMLEERERLYNTARIPVINKDSLKLVHTTKIDSVKSELAELVNRKKKELDSLRNGIDQVKSRIDSVQRNITGRIATARQKINRATKISELISLSQEYGVNLKNDKWQNILSGIKSFGLGRSVVNYSELTAKDVSLTGINIEYNSRMYFAVAAGKVDYGFRDFFGRNNRLLNQHLLLGRIGMGDKEVKALIFSFYTGRKANYGSVLHDTATGSLNVTGYSVEALIKKDEFTSVSAEIAKSTRPVTGRFTDNKELSSLFRFSDMSNIGISIKGQTRIHETNTRISGFFRKTGENFQSFSLFSYNTDQTSWLIKADQSFWKERISLAAALRRNDFVSPFTEKTFKTTTVFSSVQLGIRIPRWPALSVGYYPGSQLYIIDKNRIRENVYYILNGTIIHNYKLFGLRMISSAIYNNYSTRGTDSGFINYNGVNYILSQSLLFNKLQAQGNFIYTDQQELRFYTLEGNLDYSIAKYFRVGVGVKYNHIHSGKEYWGGRAQVMIDMKKIGVLQLQYDKSYLPTIQQTLFPVETGRLSWFKYF